MKETLLIHYCPFSNGLNILKSRQLRLSSLQNFNDPFESLMTSKISKELATYSLQELEDLILALSDKNGLSALDTKAYKLGKTLGTVASPLGETSAIIICLMGVSVSFFLNALKKDKAYINYTEKLKTIKTRIKHIESIVLSCFSENYDSILMWSHYANKHSGIAISFKSGLEYWGGDNFKKVKYQNNRLTIHSSASSFNADEELDLLCSKALFWSYEQEWRFIKYKKFCKKFVDEFNNEIYYESIDSKAISAIYLGCRTTKEDEAILIEYCKKNLPQIPIYKACPDDNLYKLKMNLIH